MRNNHEDTPPSSISGDDITGQEDDIVYMEDLDEIDEDGLNNYDGEDEEMTVDHSVTVFNKHGGSVFSCDIHPNGEIAASGGEDDKAFVWRISDAQIIMETSGHKDSVIFVGFSFDGTYLATGDMAGILKVWECNTNDMKPWNLILEYDTDEMLWGRWHKKARVLLCGTNSGSIYMFKIPSGETKILPGHNVRVDCAKVFNDGLHLAAGYSDGLIKIWDLKKNTVVHHIATDADSSGISDLDIHSDDKVVASINTEGYVIFSSNGKIVGKLSAGSDLETVSFCQDSSLGYLAVGSLTGYVTIWDASRQMIRNYCTKSEDLDSIGVMKLFWIKDKLVAGCLDGSIRVYDGRSGARVLMLTGHQSELLDLCYNEKKKIILTACDDHTARIFKYEID